MAADTLKSLSVTTLDTIPAIANTAGEGGQGFLKSINDFVTPTAAGLASTSSTYKMVRLPSNVKVKAMKLSVAAAIETSTGLTLDLGAYYSDSTVDGTNYANQGVLISANAFLAASSAFQSSAVADVNAFAAVSPAKRNLPLWSVLGLASDPGGFIDIVLAVHAAATGAASQAVGLQVDYVL